MTVNLVQQLVGAAIRAFGLGLVTLIGLWLFRIRSSAARHAAWTVVLAGMLLQIPLAVVAPTVPLKAMPTLPVPIPQQVMESVRISVPLARTLPPANRTRPEPNTSTDSKRVRVSSSATIAVVYLAISMLLFTRMALGSRGLRRILRDARPIHDLGSGIFESALFVAPGSVGCFRTKIILPRAWKGWDAAKLQAVLAHEKAHIRRRDWLIQVASHVNVCIFWFHPLAWWMERELARLAEEACDDLALAGVEDGEAYAATLVDIARAAAAAGGVLNWRVISMAKESNVIRRVNRILNRNRRVPKPFGRLAWAALFACSLPVIYLSATVKLAPPNRDSTALTHAAVPAPPGELARRSLLPQQKSSMRLIAQATPNQSPRPAPPLTPFRPEDLPITMCVVIDNSGSMREKRTAVRMAALALVKASNPHDEVCIVDFNDDASIDLPHGKDFTSDIHEMEEVLTRIESRGGSALRDAIGMSIDHVKQRAHNDRKVLVLVTDGNDNSSATSPEQLLSKVKNSGVRVYSIGLLGEDHPRETKANRRALEQLAEASGGLDYYPKDLAEVESLSHQIANEIRKR
jgi:beta-lactamase regulating signal transducer with metallopeptidase domain